MLRGPRQRPKPQTNSTLVETQVRLTDRAKPGPAGTDQAQELVWSGGKNLFMLRK